MLATPVSVPPFAVGLAVDGMIELAARTASARVVVSYSRLEWDTFVEGVTLDGEFTLEWLALAS